MENSRVLVRPLFTEKSLAEAATGEYSFVVDPKATKGEIASAIKARFNVDVKSVKTRIIKGRTKRIFRRREEVKTSPIKKATVKLGKEQKIDIFEVKQ